MDEEFNKWQEKQQKGYNKGLEIRHKKLVKKSQQRAKKKPGQIGLVRFVEFQWEAIDRIDGKYRPTGRQFSQGLQIENRIYLINGHYKMVNNNGLKITKKYDGIPEWATDALKEMYNQKLEQFVHTSIFGGAAELGEDQR